MLIIIKLTCPIEEISIAFAICDITFVLKFAHLVLYYYMETVIKSRIIENYDVLKLHKSLELVSISHMLLFAWNGSCWALHENNALRIYFLLLWAFVTFWWTHSNQCIIEYVKGSDSGISSTYLALCHGLRTEIGTLYPLNTVFWTNNSSPPKFRERICLYSTLTKSYDF